MNRRNLLRALAALPLLFVKGRLEAVKSFYPPVVGVKETPWLVRKVIVYCDDVSVSRCVRVSESGGWYECHQRDCDGRFVLNADGTEIRTVRHYGKIEIRMVDV